MPATMNPGEVKGKNASTAITKKRFVKLDSAATDGETVKACDTAGEVAYGVALFSCSVSEALRGKGASVIISGRAIVEAAAQINAGQAVSTDATGKAQVATTGQIILGYCDEPAAAAGNECSVVLDKGGVSA